MFFIVLGFLRRFKKKKKKKKRRFVFQSGSYTHPDYDPATASPKSASGKAACPCFHQRKISHICV